jgi:tetratricopeptide (TPR) repeat protein
MRHIRIKLLALTVFGVSVLWAQTAEMPPDAVALAQRAVQLQQARDYPAAAEAYRALLKMQPNDIATHVNLGVVLVNLGRFDEAIAEYEAADKLLPNDPRIALNIALAYQKSGRIKETETRFEALHKSAPQENRITMLLADCYLQTGDDDRVIELLQPMEAQQPDDLALAYMLGLALLHKGRIDEGQVRLDRILRNGDTAEARFLLGTRMFESGDYPAAVKQLAGAIDLNPNLPQLQSLYGRALLNTGDADAAGSAFQKALVTDANDYAANLGLGQMLTFRKQFNDAIPPLRRALQVRPASAEAELALAQCLTGTGQLGAARPYAERAEQAMPRSAEVHQTLASIYAGLHLAKEAAHERTQAQSLEQAANASDPGPQRNTPAPDFALPDAVSGAVTHLHDFRGKTPLVLVFGSYSCPNFRSSAEALKAMYKSYGSRLPFLLIYIREAHGSDNWQSTRNTREGVAVPSGGTFAEKQGNAALCSRRLHLPFPALVDGMDGGAETAYHAWPSRAFVVGADGRVLYSTRLTELDFKPQEMENVLRQAAGGERASTK